MICGGGGKVQILLENGDICPALFYCSLYKSLLVCLAWLYKQVSYVTIF